MADRIVVLKDGVIEQTGTPLELYDRPRNAFVAGFIGSPAMNFLDGRVALGGRPRVVTDDGLELPLADDAPLAAADEGRRVLYGIRPEHFRLDASAGAEAEVVVVEPTGSETQIVLRYGGRDVTAAFRDRLGARPGDRLPLAPIPSEGHLFDASTGRRIGNPA